MASTVLLPQAFFGILASPMKIAAVLGIIAACGWKSGWLRRPILAWVQRRAWGWAGQAGPSSTATPLALAWRRWRFWLLGAIILFASVLAAARIHVANVMNGPQPAQTVSSSPHPASDPRR